MASGFRVTPGMAPVGAVHVELEATGAVGAGHVELEATGAVGAGHVELEAIGADRVATPC